VRSVCEGEAFSSLLGDIYDAALEPGLWPGAMNRAAGFIGATAACLMNRDVAGGPGGMFLGFGDQPHYRRLYFEKYIRLDPVATVLPRLNPGQVVSDSSITPPAEFLTTRFCEEWMEPQGWLDRVFVILDRSQNQIIVFSIARSTREGWADEGVYQRMRLIAPHLRRSVLVCQAAGLQRIEATTLADTLDCLNAGVFLIDRDGQFVHANARGSDMLAQGVLPGALFEVLARTTAGDKAMGDNGFAMPLESPKGDRYVAHLLPLASAARRLSGSYSAVAAVFIQKGAPASPGLVPVIARHYRLTPTETRVLVTILQVGSVLEAAIALGIAETTVKTHLSHVFTKTQTSGQGDLVKLVAGFSSVFPHR
jgi:DNA-binding CsgD family transcriptional regulator/PAS domain-containing protein